MQERERERERENGERAGGLEIKRRNKWLIMRPARKGAKDTKWDKVVPPACRFCRFARNPPDDDDGRRVAACLVVGERGKAKATLSRNTKQPSNRLARFRAARRREMRARGLKLSLIRTVYSHPCDPVGK